MTLLDRLKNLCVKNSITLSALEKKLNFGNGTLSRWNTSSPSVDKMERVANYFHVSIDYLVGREGNSENSPPSASSNETPVDFYTEFKAAAQILGYKIISKNKDVTCIEHDGEETLLKSAEVLSLADRIKSYMKFNLQEAIHTAKEEYSEEFSTILVAARGGVYELDKDTAEKLAQSASKAPNRSHDRKLF